MEIEHGRQITWLCRSHLRFTKGRPASTVMLCPSKTWSVKWPETHPILDDISEKKKLQFSQQQKKTGHFHNNNCQLSTSRPVQESNSPFFQMFLPCPHQPVPPELAGTAPPFSLPPRPFWSRGPAEPPPHGHIFDGRFHHFSWWFLITWTTWTQKKMRIPPAKMRISPRGDFTSRFCCLKMF